MLLTFTSDLDPVASFYLDLILGTTRGSGVPVGGGGGGVSVV